MKTSRALSLLLALLWLAAPTLSRAKQAASRATAVKPASQPKTQSKPKSKKEAPLSYERVYRKLSKRKVRAAFIKELRKLEDPATLDSITRLNVLGFLRTADYSGHLTSEATEQCRKFMNEHLTALLDAEAEYGVPKEVVTSLLWVETRHGRNLGKFSTPAVYLNLAMADHPAMVRQTTELMLEEVGSDHPRLKEYRQKIRERSKSKAKWAIDQLIALSKMQRKLGGEVMNTRGSYAGAFGWPQFIPASYLSWAKQAKSPLASNAHPNLFDASDAIHSVAHYLKAHGWQTGKKDTPEARREALFGYNKSTDYVETILTLAERLQ
jgi:membrane-bound lytic murein transglycosylase B